MEQCRVCLASRRKLVSLFLNRPNGSYADTLSSITRVQVSVNDGLADKICCKCAIFLNKVMKFKRVAEESDRRFRARCSQLSIKLPAENTSFGTSRGVKNKMNIKMKPKLEMEIEVLTNQSVENLSENINGKDNAKTRNVNPNDIDMSALVPDVSMECQPNADIRDDSSDADDDNSLAMREIKPKEAKTELRKSHTSKANLSNSSIKTRKIRMSSKSKVSERRGQLRNLRTSMSNRDEVRFGTYWLHLKRYSCSQCDRTFAQKNNMLTHLRTHSGLKDNICVCGAQQSEQGHAADQQNMASQQPTIATRRCVVAPHNLMQRPDAVQPHRANVVSQQRGNNTTRPRPVTQPADASVSNVERQQINMSLITRQRAIGKNMLVPQTRNQHTMAITESEGDYSQSSQSHMESRGGDRVIARQRTPNRPVQLVTPFVPAHDTSMTAKMFIFLQNGEQRLISFLLPRESCTLQEILEQVNVPFTDDTHIQCMQNYNLDIDYFVAVGITTPIEELVQNMPSMRQYGGNALRGNTARGNSETWSAQTQETTQNEATGSVTSRLLHSSSSPRARRAEARARRAPRT